MPAFRIQKPPGQGQRLCSLPIGGRSRNLCLCVQPPAAVRLPVCMRIDAAVPDAQRVRLHQPHIPVDAGAGIPAGIRLLKGHTHQKLIGPGTKASRQLKGKAGVTVFPLAQLFAV